MTRAILGRAIFGIGITTVIVALSTVDASAFALLTYNGQPIYWTNVSSGGPACAKFSIGTGYTTCDIGLHTTAALQARSGWDTTVTYAANQWQTIDNSLGQVAFEYVRTSYWGYPVTVDAADLGG